MFVCVCVIVSLPVHYVDMQLHHDQVCVSPLHHACEQSDNAAVVGLLLDRGADSNAKDEVRVNIHTASTFAQQMLTPHTCLRPASLMRGVVPHVALLALC